MDIRLRRLLVIYMGALLLLVATFAFSLLQQHRASVQLHKDTHKISQSVQQQMLSQHIVYLAQDLPLRMAGPDQGFAIADFKSVIDLFEDSQNSLSAAPDLNPAVARLYFDDFGQGSLDVRIRAFIKAARDVAERPGEMERLEALKSIERSGLEADLDVVATQFEDDRTQLIEALLLWEWYGLWMMLLIVLAKVVFVFLPGYRFVLKTMNELMRQNLALQLAHGDLIAKQAALENSLEASETLRQERAEFTYAISHDLKSPANSMSLFLNELALGNEANLDDDGKFLLGLCRETVARMADQVDNVLAYSGVTEVKTLPERFAMADTVDVVLLGLEASVREAHASVSVGDLPEFSGHKAQIAILVQNLIENALKYRDPGRAPLVHIWGEASGTGRCITLHVSDNGIGIEPQHHQTIFGLFQRLHLREDYSGSGLGLCTCRRIAENHNGKISVTSVPGEGTTFSVTLDHLAAGPDYHLQEAA